MIRTLLGLTLPALVPAAAALTLALAPGRADACGGFFCDGGPQGMPVDQSGENILFAFDGDTVEVHIQIAYDPNTDASKFSWVIPVTALPEFFVGSEVLFDNVLNGTVPFYGRNTVNEICGDSGFGTMGTTGTSTSGGSDSATDGGTGDTGGPNVVYEATVGAFDVVVLEGGNTDEVVQWLNDNGYQQDPEAVPILDAYLKEGNLFAAFKLAPAEKPVVHPIVLRYKGVEPCVPIRLTRIAAVEDMDIRVFFLGDHRAIPTNYRHVLVNPLKIDWPGLGANYKEVVTAAVDAFKAEGNAFVTEYAGPSDVIPTFGLFDPGWDPKAFNGLWPTDVAAELQNQGLLYCEDYGEVYCNYNHPLLLGLLLEHLPPPDGISPDEFYYCLSCYEGMIDLLQWGDGSGFANAFTDRIYNPGERALGLLQSKPYVTRMYTTISPHEMLEDPVFFENADLPPVDNTRIAQRYIRCDGHAEYTLPDGRWVFIPNNGPWPDFPGEMPWEEETQQMAMAGPPQVLNSNTALIDQLLAEWNAQAAPSATGGTETGSGSPTETSDASATSGGQSGDDGGCGCTSDPGGGALASLALFGLVGLAGRRRRA
ncbi:MAG: DUF2330 domain-containing protein [Nannocystaceae bacterium]